MNAKDFKVICVGIGEMGKAGVRTLLGHKVRIVAAVDINEAVVGKDVGEYSGCPACGVKIEKDLRAAVEREKPNIAFFASDPGMDRLYPDMMICAENKINVVMTVMDPYFRMESYAKEFDEIDAAFKNNGVSLFSSGINDIWWSGIGMDMAGACKSIDSIDFSNKLPLNGMGAGVARDFRVNGDPDEFRSDMAGHDLAAEESISGPLMALYANAAIMKLHIKEVKITAEPICAEEETPMPQWDMVIGRGRMLGQSFSVKMTTEENITLTTSMIIKVLTEGEKPGTSWTIKGEPDLYADLGDICGEITTSSITINRIPEIVAARPGIITLADLLTRPVYHPGEWTEV